MLSVNPPVKLGANENVLNSSARDFVLATTTHATGSRQ